VLVEFFVLHWGFVSPKILPLPTQNPDGPFFPRGCPTRTRISRDSMLKLHLRHAPRRREARLMLVEFLVLHWWRAVPLRIHRYPHKRRMFQNNPPAAAPYAGSWNDSGNGFVPIHLLAADEFSKIGASCDIASRQLAGHR
jgi:hypothetical protein